MIHISTQTAMTGLMLSGCTMTSDHLYVYLNGYRLDDSIDAAAEMGMRFHASRGSMSVGQKQGGLPPDSLIEKEAAILEDTQRVIERYMIIAAAPYCYRGRALFALLSQLRADENVRRAGPPITAFRCIPIWRRTRAIFVTAARSSI